MDTLEAVSTIVALWPNSFKPQDKWRQMLADEFENWSREEIAAAVNAVKATHNGRKVSIDTFRAARGKSAPRAAMSGFEPESPSTQGYGYAAQQWLRDNGLWEKFKAARSHDQVMIRRLVAVLMLTPGWEMRLQEAAGDENDFPPWTRIENLAEAANKATVTGRKGDPVKICWVTGRDGSWSPPRIAYEVQLPPPPKPISEEENAAGVDRIIKIAAKHGGLKSGNYTRILEDPEYQQYLEEYHQRHEGYRPKVVYKQDQQP